MLQYWHTQVPAEASTRQKNKQMKEILTDAKQDTRLQMKVYHHGERKGGKRQLEAAQTDLRVPACSQKLMKSNRERTRHQPR